MTKPDFTVSPLAHIPVDACRALWCNVLSMAWEDALHPSITAHPKDVERAQSWFGGRDFWQVCALAGVEGDRILKGFHAALSSGDPRSAVQRKRIAA
ncbi:hypothetical protein [Paracoccus saliphilus]|uniref:Uncharacterized protein n=1 Tax=Paracoccus saliphilus TaxID=405559 RepID=A0AA45W615_9RHOB|nr:hypothetical protein [Paracoccus saliphilus]WCR01653.1 hypothetical protein JHX88_11990 [Paracoccus saliphilus]SIS98299.1 hypothetical protein SAMN05421772_11118 [Paracoccus saliphilus]